MDGDAHVGRNRWNCVSHSSSHDVSDTRIERMQGDALEFDSLNMLKQVLSHPTFHSFEEKHHDLFDKQFRCRFRLASFFHSSDHA